MTLDSVATKADVMYSHDQGPVKVLDFIVLYRSAIQPQGFTQASQLSSTKRLQSGLSERKGRQIMQRKGEEGIQEKTRSVGGKRMSNILLQMHKMNPCLDKTRRLILHNRMNDLVGFL